MRHNGRQPDELRPLEVLRQFTQNAPGSVLIRMGNTHVFCTATIEDGVPEWRLAGGAGWLTAEYDMLPGSTGQRRPRNRTRLDGRTQEIQRLIGRSLRAVANLERLGQRTIYLDCDVLQADGGTRTAAITGAYLALCDALAEGRRRGWWGADVLVAAVAAVSVGLVDGELLLDLDYREDARASVDGNLVLSGRNEWIEVQFTAERAPFSDAQLTDLLALGRRGIEKLLLFQQDVLRREPDRPK